MRGGAWLDEPATALTDFAIAALCAWFASATIHAAVRGEGAAVMWWGAAFVSTGLAAAFGGAAHGFASRMPPSRLSAVWRASLYALAATGFLMLVSMATSRPGVGGAALLAVGVAKAVAVAIRIHRRALFGDVLLDYAVSMVLVAAVQLQARLAGGAPSAPWLIAAVAVSFVAGAIQHFRVAPHPRFNHNDLYHAVQMGALYLFYRGGIMLGE